LKNLKYHIFLLLVMGWFYLFSQQYTHFTDKDGLPSNHIYRITQDYQGFIWFITDKGITKYNGTTFKTFTTKEGLQTNDIWDIRITKDNRVWFFSKASQLGYIYNDTVYSFPSTLKNQILYPIGINQSQSEIQFSDRNNHYYLKGKKWHFVKHINDSVQSIEPVIHPRYKDYLVKYRSEKAYLRDTNQTVISALYLGKIIKGSFYRGQINDSLFCWVNDHQFIIHNLNTTRFFNYSLNKLNSKFIRFSLVNDKIFFSGLNFVAELNRNYQLDSVISIPKEFKSHYTLIDRNDNLWSATFGNGVYFLPASKRKALYRLEGEKAGRLQWINNQLVVGVYNKGFYQYDPDTKAFIPFIKDKDFIFNAVTIDSLHKSYFITNSHVYIKDKNKMTKFAFLETGQKRKFGTDLVYSKHYLYSNTSSGINKIDPANLRVIKELLQLGIRDILSLNDVVYLASANGLKYIENDTIKNVWNDKNILNKPIISLQKIDSNKIVVCTDGFGAYTTDFKTITPLEKSEFLAVQNAFYQNDSLWLATNKGIWLYTSTANKKYTLSKKYTTQNGLTTNLINAVTIVDDAIIATTNNGICIIPKKQPKTNTELSIYFDNSYYNQQLIRPNEKYRYTFNNHIDINVSNIDFSDTHSKISYQYKLAPIQKQWIQTTSNSLVFSNLPPDAYQLSIRSGTQTDTINFSITPLWWQRPIAKIGFIVIGFLSLFGFLLWLRKRELDKKTAKINAQRKLAEYELYALRSQMNPHFVFNSLNAIQYYLNDNKIELSEKYLVKFSKLIRMFFDFSRYDEISIQEEIQLLKAYLEIEKLRFGEKLNFQIIRDPKLSPSQSIPAMLLQPIVENAVNHGLFHKQSPGFIKIEFRRIKASTYRVIIEDDGVGRKKSDEIKQSSLRKHESKSTRILEDRIHLLNQSKRWNIQYEISDLNQTADTGTRVSLIFERL